jgi:hypothetical protein
VEHQSNIYGHYDYSERENVRNMRLPGTWCLGWRNKALILYDPCSDARLADLQKRIEHLEKKGWHENAEARAQQLKRLRALKGTSSQIVGPPISRLYLWAGDES